MTTHTSTIRRTLSSLAATGLLVLTTTSPAIAEIAPAMRPPDPIGDEPAPTQIVQAPAAADEHIEYLQIGLGALGGVAITALAVGAATSVRHHRPHGHAIA